MSTNNTGTIKMANKVAANMPPNTVQPMVARATAPAPVAKAKGNTPNIKAMEVMIMGRNLSLTASSVAGITSIPLSTLSLANSTIRMAFLAASPIKVISPICAYTLSVSLGMSVNVSIAPKAPMGTANNTENGTAQLSYKAAKKRNTKAIDKANMYTVLEPALISLRLNPENS